jgi:hypothetical protein
MAAVLLAMLGVGSSADTVRISDGVYTEVREDQMVSYDVTIQDGVTLTLHVIREGWAPEVVSDTLEIYVTRVISHDTYLIGPVVP